MDWFAVRSVYLFGVKRNGRNIFEERIVCFRAASADEAHGKAAEESRQYAEDNGLEAHPERESYEQDGDDLIDGYELWSELFEADQSLGEFYASRYTKYDYVPDPRPGT